LSGRDRLRAAAGRIEDAAEGGHRNVPRADVSDEMSRSSMSRVTARVVLAFVAAVLPAGAATGQMPASQPPATGQIAPAPSGVPLTLQDALTQARINSQQFRSAQLTADLATEDRKIARAALLMRACVSA